MASWRQQTKAIKSTEVTNKGSWRPSFVKHNRTNITETRPHCQKLNLTISYKQLSALHALFALKVKESFPLYLPLDKQVRELAWGTVPDTSVFSTCAWSGCMDNRKWFGAVCFKGVCWGWGGSTTETRESWRTVYGSFGKTYIRKKARAFSAHSPSSPQSCIAAKQPGPWTSSHGSAIFTSLWPGFFLHWLFDALVIPE